ncbi:hypothetical protein T492DRAFT_959209 [Pavlovales sp. CCMP2436]|nr:hypothetical protein T492DRAFT_959209 [Pavlovales sp. CCMP2436]
MEPTFFAQRLRSGHYGQPTQPLDRAHLAHAHYEPFAPPARSTMYEPHSYFLHQPKLHLMGAHFRHQSKLHPSLAHDAMPSPYELSAHYAQLSMEEEQPRYVYAMQPPSPYELPAFAQLSMEEEEPRYVYAMPPIDPYELEPPAHRPHSESHFAEAQAIRQQLTRAALMSKQHDAHRQQLAPAAPVNKQQAETLRQHGLARAELMHTQQEQAEAFRQQCLACAEIIRNQQEQVEAFHQHALARSAKHMCKPQEQAGALHQHAFARSAEYIRKQQEHEEALHQHLARAAISSAIADAVAREQEAEAASAGCSGASCEASAEAGGQATKTNDSGARQPQPQPQLKPEAPARSVPQLARELPSLASASSSAAEPHSPLEAELSALEESVADLLVAHVLGARTAPTAANVSEAAGLLMRQILKLDALADKPGASALRDRRRMLGRLVAKNLDALDALAIRIAEPSVETVVPAEADKASGGKQLHLAEAHDSSDNFELVSGPGSEPGSPPELEGADEAMIELEPSSPFGDAADQRQRDPAAAELASALAEPVAQDALAADGLGLRLRMAASPSAADPDADEIAEWRETANQLMSTVKQLKQENVSLRLKLGFERSATSSAAGAVLV